MPALRVGPKPLTIQQLQKLERNRPGSSASDEESTRDDSMEPAAPIDLDSGQHWMAKDVEKMIEEEKIPKPPRELMDPKDKIQSTEKYLNTELEELGLAEFIGKDKKNPEYKKVVTAARSAAKEKKKADALAAKGLRSVQPLKSPRPTSAPTEEILSDSPDEIMEEPVPDRARAAEPAGEALSESLDEVLEEPEFERAPAAESVEAPVEPQAPALKAAGRKPRAKTTTGRKSSQRNSDASADEISSKVTIEPVVNVPTSPVSVLDGLDNPIPAGQKPSIPARRAPRKKVAAQSTRSRASVAPAAVKEPAARAKTTAARGRRSTKTPAPLAEITNQQKKEAPASGGKGRPPAAKVTTPPKTPEEEVTATEVVTPLEGHKDQPAAEQENEAESRVMTRRQLKEAEIQKRDRLAQELMEIEEA